MAEVPRPIELLCALANAFDFLASVLVSAADGEQKGANGGGSAAGEPSGIVRCDTTVGYVLFLAPVVGWSGVRLPFPRRVSAAPQKCSAYEKGARPRRSLIVLPGFARRACRVARQTTAPTSNSFLTAVTRPFYSSARFRCPVRGKSDAREGARGHGYPLPRQSARRLPAFRFRLRAVCVRNTITGRA